MEQLNYKPPLMFTLFPAPGPLLALGDRANNLLSLTLFEPNGKLAQAARQEGEEHRRAVRGAGGGEQAQLPRVRLAGHRVLDGVGGARGGRARRAERRQRARLQLPARERASRRRSPAGSGSRRRRTTSPPRATWSSRSRTSAGWSSGRRPSGSRGSRARSSERTDAGSRRERRLPRRCVVDRLDARDEHLRPGSGLRGHDRRAVRDHGARPLAHLGPAQGDQPRALRADPRERVRAPTSSRRRRASIRCSRRSSSSLRCSPSGSRSSG